jgi:flavin reductase (DIM6/NTAB) family NADH-FMN oxidoreductase RutF
VDNRALSIACCAERGEARFHAGEWRDDDDTRVPVLVDAQASIICVTDRIHHYGTHAICVGPVVRAVTAGPIRPLLYMDGRYTATR